MALWQTYAHAPSPSVDRLVSIARFANFVALAALVAALVVAVSGCTDDTDPPWQLDHDRIIAVRATPPRIAAGEQAVIDGLVGFKGAAAAQQSPETVTVASPASLAAVVTFEAGSSANAGVAGGDGAGADRVGAADADGGARWIVTAPSAEQLTAARAELGLASDALVPLVVDVTYGSGALRATKTIWLGGDAGNPEMAGIEIDRAAAAADGTSITVAPDTDIPLSIGLSDADYDVTWLSSCGTMHDFDLPSARLHVEPGDPTAGQLALVVRDSLGGVAWRIWPIQTDAQPAP